MAKANSITFKLDIDSEFPTKTTMTFNLETDSIADIRDEVQTAFDTFCEKILPMEKK